MIRRRVERGRYIWFVNKVCEGSVAEQKILALLIDLIGDLLCGGIWGMMDYNYVPRYIIGFDLMKSTVEKNPKPAVQGQHTVFLCCV